MQQINYSFPFQKLELDLGPETFSDKELNLSGSILVVPNNIVPVGYNTSNAQIVKPTIKFNTKTSPELELQPFSIFQLNFERIFLNSFPILGDDSNIKSTKLVFLSSTISKVDIFNFRNSVPFKISNVTALDVVAGVSSIPFYVPSGAKNLTLSLSLTATVGNESIGIYGDTIAIEKTTYVNRETLIYETGLASGTIRKTYQIDCEGYQKIMFNIIKDASETSLTCYYVATFN